MVSTHVIGTISAKGGAPALRAGAAVGIGTIRVDAIGASRKKESFRMLTTRPQLNGSSKRRRLGGSKS